MKETFIDKSEVIKHNSSSDCWIILFNKVYDVTSFVKIHPGGSHIFVTRAGEDCTSYFVARHGYNKRLINHLAQYQVGVLHQHEQIPASDLEEPFMKDLVEECTKRGLYKISKANQIKFFAIRVVLVSIFFVFAALVLFNPLPFYWVIPLVITQSLIGASLFGLLAHEHTHRDYPTGKIYRFLLRVAWPIFWPFISQNPLVYEHNSHHIKIGDPEFDFEVIGFSHFIKYSAKIEHRRIHAYQHKMAFLLYFFYANIITTTGGIFSKFWSSHNRSVALEHSISVLWSLSFFIIIPFAFTGYNLLYFIGIYLLYQCVLFFFVYVGAAINHFTPSATNKIPEEMKNKYAYYVCANTSNFSASNLFWFWLTGGFNVQIEHHLVPFVPVENLREMIPIVKGLCKKHGYPYYDYSSFKSMWDDHYGYLAMLSSKETNALTLNEVMNKDGYQAR